MDFVEKVELFVVESAGINRISKVRRGLELES
jgi:hypothetical protein